MSSLFQIRMGNAQEVTAPFSERRFLESKNQAVKKDSYDFQTSSTWHKSADVLESQALHSGQGQGQGAE